jgi:tetratricopeptide (TPR) repeat protein
MANQPAPDQREIRFTVFNRRKSINLSVLKSEKDDSRRSEIGDEKAAPRRPEPRADSAAQPGRAHRWWFRFSAAVLPLLLLILVEIGLRFSGYGYPIAFFLKGKINGQPVYLDNQQFAERYFPHGLARSPQPFAVPAKKPPGTIRILVFGESAAMGDPEPDFGFARILEVLMRGRFPEREFEVVNCAVTAINSHAIREIAKEAAPLEADFWLIYMGNNEVVGPYGAGTIFSEQTPPLSLIRASIALKRSRTGQLLDSIRQKFSSRRDVPANWQGMEMFLRQRVPQEDPRMARVYDHFERNLEDLISLGVKAGARVLVSTIVCNLRDCAPFASTNQSGIDLARWQALYRVAAKREDEATNSSTAGAALVRLLDVAQIDGSHAELQFRMARCYARIGDLHEARRCFEKARDLDTLRFRADTRMNRIIGQTAVKHDSGSVELIDAAEAFQRRSPLDVPGEEVFYEHVHFNFAGNYLLARTFAEEMARQLSGTSSAQADGTNWLSLEECARHLAFTDWDRYQVVDEVVKRLEQPPFTMQLGHRERMARFQTLRAEMQGASRAEAFPAAIAIYRDTLSRSPRDWVLRENFAELLQASGDLSSAEEQWRKVVELMPHYAEARYHLANLLDSLGKSAEAIAVFRGALARRPDLPEARNGLALALANQGRFDEAVREYEKALRQKPGFSEARVNLGQMLAQRGRTEEARQQYLEALRLNSNSAAAHLNLGKLLAQEGKIDDAISHYQAALRLNPENAVAHFNLGNAMSAKQPDLALEHYAAAVQSSPGFAEARYNLGLEFAKRGKNGEALVQFMEVVRLSPNFAEAHFNLGVALAKAGRFEEAAMHFRETLRLDPINERAQKFLQQTQIQPTK